MNNWEKEIEKTIADHAPRSAEWAQAYALLRLAKACEKLGGKPAQDGDEGVAS